MQYQKVFHNRDEAGEYLAQKLLTYRDEKPIILALPREGVPVAAKVAEILGAPLDVIVARTIYAPNNEKISIGAIAAGDVVVIDRSVQMSLALTDSEINKILETQRKELAKDMIELSSGAHVERYDSPRTVIIVDDGLAQGVTVRAAVEAAKVLYNPQHIIFASPICSDDVMSFIKPIVHDIISINRPQHMFAIGNWYDIYKSVTINEVTSYLQKLQAPRVSLFHRLGFA
jgi:putative phosphoribosyl transferase